MSIDKKEPIREGSEESMDSTPEAEAEAEIHGAQEVASVQKRKGGRKPVSNFFESYLPRYSLNTRLIMIKRFTQHRKNANSVTVRLKLPFENEEPNISNNLKKQLGSMRPICITYKLLIEAQLTNVLC